LSPPRLRQISLDTALTFNLQPPDLERESRRKNYDRDHKNPTSSDDSLSLSSTSLFLASYISFSNSILPLGSNFVSSRNHSSCGHELTRRLALVTVDGFTSWSAAFWTRLQIRLFIWHTVRTRGYLWLMINHIQHTNKQKGTEATTITIPPFSCWFLFSNPHALLLHSSLRIQILA
jgi:hypothetical protein